MDFFSNSKASNNQFIGRNTPSSPSNQMGQETPSSQNTPAKGGLSAALDALVNSVKGIFAPSSTDGQDWYKVFPYQLVAVRYKKPPPPPPAFSILNVSDLASAASPLSLLGSVANLVAPTGAPNLLTGPPKEETVIPIDKCFVYTLPIPPESLTISMLSASGATATFDGVVEETSATVFWDIQISGTTGMAVSYGPNSDSRGMADSFRTSISSTGLLIDAKTSLAKAVGGVGAIIDAGVDAASAIGSSDSIESGASNIFGGLAGVLDAATLPKLPYSSSAVDGKSNGFTTIKDLHYIFQTYAENKEQEPDMYDLFFVNQKDDQVYQVILKGGLQIQKSVRDPYLYRYSFALQAWDRTDLINSVFQLSPHAIDRYKSDLASVNTFTLPQLNRIMSNIGANAVSHPQKLITL